MVLITSNGMTAKELAKHFEVLQPGLKVVKHYRRESIQTYFRGRVYVRRFELAYEAGQDAHDPVRLLWNAGIEANDQAGCSVLIRDGVSNHWVDVKFWKDTSDYEKARLEYMWRKSK